MMTLISLAISVAFLYSLATIFVDLEEEALALAAGIEGDSEHVIALADVICQESRQAIQNWNIFMPPAVGALVMSLNPIIVAINAQTLRRLSL